MPEPSNVLGVKLGSTTFVPSEVRLPREQGCPRIEVRTSRSTPFVRIGTEAAVLLTPDASGELREVRGCVVAQARDGFESVTYIEFAAGDWGRVWRAFDRRAATRVSPKAGEPVALDVPAAPYAKLVDVSVSGCAILVVDESRIAHDDWNVEVGLRLPGMVDALIMAGHVRSHTEVASGILLGVEFIGAADPYFAEKQRRLQRYVTARMLEIVAESVRGAEEIPASSRRA